MEGKSILGSCTVSIHAGYAGTHTFKKRDGRHLKKNQENSSGNTHKYKKSHLTKHCIWELKKYSKFERGKLQRDTDLVKTKLKKNRYSSP